jgi:LPXTG-site transpeptidase (sortase) family protein
MGYFKPHRYIKDESKNPLYHPVSRRFVFNMAFYPVLFTSLGVFFLITQIIFPLVVFTSAEESYKPAEASVLGIASGFSKFEFEELTDERGRTTKGDIPEEYYLTIPKLNIRRAVVDSAPPDYDPSDALGHYIGSTMPGLSGNTFIYGHSVLPAFFNPRNYKTIFSTLHLLNIGDEIDIEYNNKKYTYRIESKVDLKPQDVNPLKGFKPAYLNESTVTLMTCYPPGTKMRRLLVNAVLEE